MMIGLSIGDLYADGDVEARDAAHKLKGLHFLFGLACSLVVLLVNSVSITYFIGTSRWSKEVTAAYSLGDEYVHRSMQLKRRCFPLAVSGMLTMLAIVALGAASDPGTLRADTEWWAMPHLLGAMIGTAYIALAFVLQRNLILQNYHVIAEVMQQVAIKQRAQEQARVDETGE